MTDTILVRVRAIQWETARICAYDLRPLDEQALPPFTSGAHVDLHLPNGLVRSYSLINSQRERHRYVIGVLHTQASRGGSRCVHEDIRPGAIVRIGRPRNNFALHEHAPHSILIGGGIGVTPLLSMIERLTELQRSWRLYYCAHDRANAAFQDDLSRYGERVECLFSDERGGQRLDIASIVAGAPNGSYFYCCGPAGMLAAFEVATSKLAPERRNLEHFSPSEEPACGGGYTVELARSRRTIRVAAGDTVLSALLRAGIEVPYSCREGLCGTCETRVLAGIPDHRDSVLSSAERASNDKMMICRSGSQSERLVLDI